MSSESSTTLTQATPIIDDDSDISRLMEPVSDTYSIIHEMNSAIPKLYNTKKTCQKTLRKLIDQLKGTHLSSAQLDNQFSNPDDAFADFCHSMGMELSNHELIEKNHIQNLYQHLLTPIKQFKNTHLKNIYRLHSRYHRTLQKINKTHQTPIDDDEYSNIIHKLNHIEHKLKNELYKLKYEENVLLLDHMSSYWISFVTSAQQQNMLMSSRTRLRSTIDEKYDYRSDEDDEGHKFEIDFDIEAIDEIVGFNNISNDITKYSVKSVNKSKKYSRVIYVDSTLKEKKIKLLSLKKRIYCYTLSDIERVEKSYKNIQLLQLKFKHKKEYYYEFPSPSKREQFVGQILEYDKYTKTNKLLSIVIGCYNVGESECFCENIKHWIKPSTTAHHHHDLYVFGLQEVKSKLKKQWIDNLLAYIDDYTDEYICLQSKFLMSIGIIIIIDRHHIAKISHIQSQTVATGKANLIGNKGAAAISFQFMETTFLFVNCHLAARAERFEKRGKNFTRIVKELKIGNIEDVDILHQFQHVFWFGDLNYRIEKDFNEVIRLIDSKEWSQILRFDQLSHAMNHDTVFSGFTEGKIHFCPTYRWSKTSNVVSNKRNQPPSYTDRILYRSLPNSLSLWQETYTSHLNCFGSDHRPILSQFRFKPRIPYSFIRKYSGISISFVELRATLQNAKINNNGIDILFNFIYSQPTQHKLIGGKYGADGYFRWPMIELDDLKIEPFVSDPSFLCTTHISLSFMQKHNILGYAVISLFNAFPKTLIDTEALKQRYMTTNMQMDTMKPKNIIQNEMINHQANHKQFKIVISKQGAIVGELEGMIFIDGKIIRKHLRYSTMDAHKKAKKPLFKINNDAKLFDAMKARSMVDITFAQSCSYNDNTFLGAFNEDDQGF